VAIHSADIAHKDVRQAYLPYEHSGDVHAAIRTGVIEVLEDPEMLYEVGQAVAGAAADDATSKAAAAQAAAEAAAALDATAKADAAEAAAEAYTDTKLEDVNLDELATLTQEMEILDDTVSLDPAAASFNLSDVVPIGAVILGVQLRLITTVTGANGGTNIGVGTAALASKYGMTTGLASGLTIDKIPNWKVLTIPEDIRVWACGESGVAHGTIGGAGESLKVRVTYLTLVPLP